MAKQTKKEKHWTKYRQLKNITEKALKKPSGDTSTASTWNAPECPQPIPNQEKGTLFTESSDKDEILNLHFTLCLPLNSLTGIPPFLARATQHSKDLVISV